MARDTARIRYWLLFAGGLALFHLCAAFAGSEDALWFVPVGVGLVLTAWLGIWTVLPVLGDFILVRQVFGGDSFPRAAGDGVCLAGQIALSWWCYSHLLHGSRRLDDPRSGIIFLLLVPGIVTGLFALVQAGFRGGATDGLWNLTAALWRSNALGILVVVPPALVLLTPAWLRWGCINGELPRQRFAVAISLDRTWGEDLELMGLALAGGLLAVVLAVLQARDITSLSLWGMSLLMVVWAALRQGLPGGAASAGLAGVAALVVSAFYDNKSVFFPLQGILLAQGSVAVLVGASVGWVRASEQRYRQVIGHIPVVLYSVRVPRWVPAQVISKLAPGKTKGENSPGAVVLRHAETTLVSPAATEVLGCHPLDLLGPFSAWVARILPEDRELLTAAVTQLCLQKQPVTCEYRLTAGLSPRPAQGQIEDLPLPNLPARPVYRWLRDTLAPHYSADGHLDGWEGVVEDITEQRRLAHDLRHASAMLHALVTHLPAGVYFVQGPQGQPIVMNPRARALLGAREDLSAGLNHLPKVFRLYRPDGSEYPWEELPVSKALRDGAPSMADDIVVHRADGRRIRLLSWAAPVDLRGPGTADAAVWVFEELAAGQRSGKK